MRTEIRTYSLMRSGHHAVLLWLAKNFQPNASVVHVAEQMGGITKQLADGEGPRLTLFENLRLREDVHPTILVIRDPYNQYASYLKMLDKPNYTQFFTFPILEYWLDYAREAAGQTDFLKNKVVINYNRWATDEEYRRSLVWDIATKFHLKMTFDDSIKNRLSTVGGGSSFDDLSFIKNANEMQVNKRYLNYADNRLYRSKVDTPEIRKLSEKLFDFYPFKPVEKTETQDMRDILDRWF